jgi:hypothetical protein
MFNDKKFNMNFKHYFLSSLLLRNDCDTGVTINYGIFIRDCNLAKFWQMPNFRKLSRAIQRLEEW